MCEFCNSQHKASAMYAANYIKSSNQLAPYVRQNFPYALRPCCCPVCGRFLQENERRNPNANATRSMCEHDYNRIFAQNVSPYCKMCGGTLDSNKINMQRQNPREVRNHICEGDCLSMWALIHNVAHGSPEFVQRYGHQLEHNAYANNNQYSQPQIRYDNSVIDADYRVVQPSQAPMIGYNPQQTPQQFFGGFVGQNNNSDDHKVKVFRVPRKGYQN